jgi:hypothetical protein
VSDRLAIAVAELVETLREELRASAPPTEVDRLLSVDEATRVLGIGRSRLNREIATWALRTVIAGRRRLIPSSSIAAYANRTDATS